MKAAVYWCSGTVLAFFYIFLSTYLLPQQGRRDGEDFEPEEKWDEDYWALVASSLIDNFCEERIQHLEIVGKKVYPLKASEENKSPCKIPMEEGARQSEKGKAAKRKKMMSGEQGKRIISEEKKKEVKANHANRIRKSGESLLSRILGSRSGR